MARRSDFGLAAAATKLPANGSGPRSPRSKRPAPMATLLSLAIISCLLITQAQAFLFTGESTSDSEQSVPLASALATAIAAPASLTSASAASGSLPASLSSGSQQSGHSPAGAALSAITSAIVSAALDTKPQGLDAPAEEHAANEGDAEASDAPASDLSPAASVASSILSSVIAPASSSAGQSAASPSAAQPSIASSIGSAVAQAAASAALNAARTTLSNGDARSLTNSQANAKNRRNQGLNLALKIVADAIPEVPYNILHNMKKLDHAAPFYNVGNKVRNTGSVKESSTGLLASALHASGGLGGAADHLGALFKSPIWKRIADGYGDFASEFRSLFKVPATNMKGPSKSTSKLLRDISVPAMLMLLASTIPSDWRPTRTRRKSLLPTDLPMAGSLPLLDPLSTSASDQFPSLAGSGFNLALQQYPPMTPRASPVNPLAQIYGQFEQANAGPNIQARSSGELQMQQQQASSLDQAISGNWATSEESKAPMESIQGSPFNDSPHGSARQQMQSVRRFGESPAVNLKQQGQPSGGLLSSLTSNFGQSKLMARIMNSNSASSGSSSSGESHLSAGVMRMKNFQHELNGPVVARQDHLSDKHRYSLVDDELVDSSQERSSGATQHHARSHGLSSAQSTKPFVLSAMSHALGSMFKYNHGSGSASMKQLTGAPISNRMYTLNAGNQHGPSALLSHQQDSLARRNHVANLVSAAALGQEQRDLTQFLPPSWRQVVKRTVNNVQQQASTQWRTIEGQLTNWVQDKLKTLPMPAAGAVSGTQSSGQGAPAAAPVANIIASVSSSAMNLLGIGGRTGEAQATGQTISSGSSDQTASSVAAPDGGKNKNEQQANKPNPIVSSAKGALAGITNLIVSSLSKGAATGQAASSLSPSTSSSATGTTPASTLDSRSSHPTVEQSAASIVSQYPTQTLDKTSISSTSMATGTASTVAAL